MRLQRSRIHAEARHVHLDRHKTNTSGRQTQRLDRGHAAKYSWVKLGLHSALKGAARIQSAREA
jgi:hypothetical protein